MPPRRPPPTPAADDHPPSPPVPPTPHNEIPTLSHDDSPPPPPTPYTPLVPDIPDAPHPPVTQHSLDSSLPRPATPSNSENPQEPSGEKSNLNPQPLSAADPMDGTANLTGTKDVALTRNGDEMPESNFSDKPDGKASVEPDGQSSEKSDGTSKHSSDGKSGTNADGKPHQKAASISGQAGEADGKHGDKPISELTAAANSTAPPEIFTPGQDDQPTKDTLPAKPRAATAVSSDPDSPQQLQNLKDQNKAATTSGSCSSKQVGIPESGPTKIAPQSPDSNAEFSFHASNAVKPTTSVAEAATPSHSASYGDDAIPEIAKPQSPPIGDVVAGKLQSPSKSDSAADKVLPDIDLSDTEAPLKHILPPLLPDDPLLTDDIPIRDPHHPSDEIEVDSKGLDAGRSTPSARQLIASRDNPSAEGKDVTKAAMAADEPTAVPIKKKESSVKVADQGPGAVKPLSRVHSVDDVDEEAVYGVPASPPSPRTRSSKRLTRQSMVEREPVSRSTPRQYSTRSRTHHHSISPVRTRRTRLSEPRPTEPRPQRMVRKTQSRKPVKGDVIRVLWDIDQMYYEGEIESVLSYRGKKFYDILYTSAEREYYLDLGSRKWRFADGRDGSTHDEIVDDDGEPVDWSDFPKIGDRVFVQWHVDVKYYPGVVRDILSVSNRQYYDVDYDGGDREFFLDLSVRKWSYPDLLNPNVPDKLASSKKNPGKTSNRNRRASAPARPNEPVVAQSSPDTSPAPSRSAMRNARARQYPIEQSKDLGRLRSSRGSGGSDRRFNREERRSAIPRSAGKWKSQSPSRSSTLPHFEEVKEPGISTSDDNKDDIALDLDPPVPPSATGDARPDSTPTADSTLEISRRERGSRATSLDPSEKNANASIAVLQSSKRDLMDVEALDIHNQPGITGAQQGEEPTEEAKEATVLLTPTDSSLVKSDRISGEVPSPVYDPTRPPSFMHPVSSTPSAPRPPPPMPPRPKLRVSDIVETAGKAAQKWAREETEGISENLDVLDDHLSVLKQLRSSNTKALKRRRAAAQKECKPESIKPVLSILPSQIIPDDEAQVHLMSMKAEVVNLVQNYRRSVEDRETSIKKQFVALKNELNDQNTHILESGKALQKLDIKGLDALKELEPTLRKRLEPSEPNRSSRHTDYLSRRDSARQGDRSPPIVSGDLRRAHTGRGEGGDTTVRNLKRRFADLVTRSDWLSEEVERLQTRESDLMRQKRNALSDLSKARAERDAAIDAERDDGEGATAKTRRASRSTSAAAASQHLLRSRGPTRSVGISKRRISQRPTDTVSIIRGTGRANRKSLPPSGNKYRPPPALRAPVVDAPAVPRPGSTPRASPQDQLWRQMDKQSSELLAMISTVWLLQDESRSEPPKSPGWDQENWVRKCVLNCVKHSVLYLEGTTGVMSAKRSLREDVDGEAIYTDWILSDGDGDFQKARSNYKLWEPGLEDAEWAVEILVLRGLSTCYGKAMIVTPAKSFSGTIAYAIAIAQKVVTMFDVYLPARFSPPPAPSLDLARRSDIAEVTTNPTGSVVQSMKNATPIAPAVVIPSASKNPLSDGVPSRPTVVGLSHGPDGVASTTVQVEGSTENSTGNPAAQQNVTQPGAGANSSCAVVDAAMSTGAPSDPAQQPCDAPNSLAQSAMTVIPASSISPTMPGAPTQSETAAAASMEGVISALPIKCSVQVVASSAAPVASAPASAIGASENDRNEVDSSIKDGPVSGLAPRSTLEPETNQSPVAGSTANPKPTNASAVAAVSIAAENAQLPPASSASPALISKPIPKVATTEISGKKDLAEPVTGAANVQSPVVSQEKTGAVIPTPVVNTKCPPVASASKSKVTPREPSCATLRTPSSTPDGTNGRVQGAQPPDTAKKSLVPPALAGVRPSPSTGAGGLEIPPVPSVAAPRSGSGVGTRGAIASRWNGDGLSDSAGAERLRQMKATSGVPDLNVPSPPPTPPIANKTISKTARGRGRPKGSLNRKKVDPNDGKRKGDAGKVTSVPLPKKVSGPASANVTSRSVADADAQQIAVSNGAGVDGFSLVSSSQRMSMRYGVPVDGSSSVGMKMPIHGKGDSGAKVSDSNANVIPARGNVVSLSGVGGGGESSGQAVMTPSSAVGTPMDRGNDLAHVGDLMNPPTPSSFPGMEGYAVAVNADKVTFESLEGERAACAVGEGDSSRLVSTGMHAGGTLPGTGGDQRQPHGQNPTSGGMLPTVGGGGIEQALPPGATRTYGTMGSVVPGGMGSGVVPSLGSPMYGGAPPPSGLVHQGHVEGSAPVYAPLSQSQFDGMSSSHGQVANPSTQVVHHVAGSHPGSSTLGHIMNQPSQAPPLIHQPMSQSLPLSFSQGIPHTVQRGPPQGGPESGVGGGGPPDGIAMAQVSQQQPISYRRTEDGFMYNGAPVQRGSGSAGYGSRPR